jgi:(p)ppGpp synthase/HD superfamily hydrolase
MAILERAIAIAAEAHAGQIEKAGAPCVLHPMRVMLAFTAN